jgi:hypothetical protein
MSGNRSVNQDLEQKAMGCISLAAQRSSLGSWLRGYSISVLEVFSSCCTFMLADASSPAARVTASPMEPPYRAAPPAPVGIGLASRQDWIALTQSSLLEGALLSAMR